MVFPWSSNAFVLKEKVWNRFLDQKKGSLKSSFEDQRVGMAGRGI